MVKTFTFALVHFSVAFGVAYVLTGSIEISGAVALVEPMLNTVAFYFHEKVWQKYEKRPSTKRLENKQVSVNAYAMDS